MLLDINHLRENYDSSSLDEGQVDRDPFRQFAEWFQAAQQAGLPDSNAMTLATCTTDGRPSARTVLLKEVDEKGFVFYSNYESRKGKELDDNPRAALLFFWQPLHRQVRIEGIVEKVDQEASARYFQSRPKDSQIGAWASPQSRVIPGRETLEDAVRQLEKEYENTTTLPLPGFWGGYRVLPELIEFWQGRVSRLHDRIQYSLQEEGDWKIERLAP